MKKLLVTLTLLTSISAFAENPCVESTMFEYDFTQIEATKVCKKLNNDIAKIRKCYDKIKRNANSVLRIGLGPGPIYEFKYWMYRKRCGEILFNAGMNASTLP